MRVKLLWCDEGISELCFPLFVWLLLLTLVHLAVSLLPCIHQLRLCLSHFKWMWPHVYTRYLHQYGSMQDGMGIVYPVTPPKLIFPRDSYALVTDVGSLPARSVQQLMKGKDRCRWQDSNERPGFTPKYFRFRSRGNPCSAILPNRWILFQCRG